MSPTTHRRGDLVTAPQLDLNTMDDTSLPWAFLGEALTQHGSGQDATCLLALVSLGLSR
jgi:hypothetical protein